MLLWRRSYDVQPPLLEKSDERHPSHDRRYDTLTDAEKTGGESLKDCYDRMLPLGSAISLLQSSKEKV